jgi:hypothetical protein
MIFIETLSLNEPTMVQRLWSMVGFPMAEYHHGSLSMVVFYNGRLSMVYFRYFFAASSRNC